MKIYKNYFKKNLKRIIQIVSQVKIFLYHQVKETELINLYKIALNLLFQKIKEVAKKWLSQRLTLEINKKIQIQNN